MERLHSGGYEREKGSSNNMAGNRNRSKRLIKTVERRANKVEVKIREVTGLIMFIP